MKSNTHLKRIGRGGTCNKIMEVSVVCSVFGGQGWVLMAQNPAPGILSTDHLNLL